MCDEAFFASRASAIHTFGGMGRQFNIGRRYSLALNVDSMNPTNRSTSRGETIMPRLCARICVGTLIAALVGCANTLQPLATAEVRVDLPHVEGEWRVGETTIAPSLQDARVKIHRRGTGSYELTLTEENQKSTWSCDTVKLGTTTFVDLAPHLEAVEDQQGAADMLTLASHVILAVEQSGDEIRLFGFDHSKLDTIASQQGIAIDSATNRRLLYVGKTKALQEFFGTTGAKYVQRAAPVLVLQRAK
jgi:hypothetical protein